MSRRAHPRSRGENCQARADDLVQIGSSPLTRGKQAVLAADEDLERLIPAHAGKTSIAVWKSSRLTAHPRSRGENGPRWRIITAATGSSPLTRGKRTRVAPY